MRPLLSREYWSGPLGLARVFTVVCATWTIAAALLGATGPSLFVPMSLMLAGLAFILGHEAKRKEP